MDKSKRSQILKLFLLASLFIITPYIPTKFRFTYFYVIFNLLIIALGAEAGLLSTFSKPNVDKKLVNLTITQCNNNNICGRKYVIKPKEREKCPSDKKVVLEAVKVGAKVKKCPSTPSIFFIGNGEYGRKNDQLEREGEEVISGQELFSKAEILLGIFISSLKCREKIHGKVLMSFTMKPFELQLLAPSRF